jgi:hypothetical protein
MKKWLLILPFIFLNFNYLEDPPDWSFGEPDKVFDLPWRIPPELEKIPVLCILRKGGGPLVYFTPRTSATVDSIKIFRFFPETGELKQLIFFDSDGKTYNTYKGNHKGDWYKIFYLDRKNFSDAEGDTVYFKVKFDNAFAISPKDYREQQTTSVFLSSKSFPKMDNWFIGDNHLHSKLTNDSNEYGPPLEIFAKAKDWFELDYITITDHCYDLDDSSWKLLQEFAEKNSNEKLSILSGQEVHARDEDTWAVSFTYCYALHFLTFGVKHRIHIGNLLLHSYNPTKTENDVIEEISKQGGFGYIAHPRETNGLGWNYESNRLKEKFYGNTVVGIEVLNEGSFNLEKNIKAIELYKELLLKGYNIKVLGNSDSHSLRLGVARTYVLSRNNSQQEILNSLKNGKTIASDGPFGYIYIINEKGQSATIGEKIEGKTFKLTARWDADPKHQFTDIVDKKIFLGKVGEKEEKIITNTIESQENSSYKELSIEIQNLEAGDYYVRAEFINSTGRKCVTSPIFIKYQ